MGENRVAARTHEVRAAIFHGLGQGYNGAIRLDSPSYDHDPMSSIINFQRCALLSLLFLAAVAAGGAPIESQSADTKTQAEAKEQKPRVIIGRVEWVVLQDVHLRMKARIDTGAGVSSLHAKILEIKQTPEGERVRFQVQDAKGATKTMERPIVDWLNIKVMGSDERSRRPVVRLDICLGGKKLEGRVNLNDRSSYLYPMLIGRNLLKTGKFLVDPGAIYLQDPGCE